jgi:hypothetical protein
MLAREFNGSMTVQERWGIAIVVFKKGALTACHRCWMEYIKRSKWALSACRLEGSRRRRPWLEACEAAREEEPA